MSPYFPILLLFGLVLAGCKTTPNYATVPNSDYPCSFNHLPFINPMIIQDLSTSISDEGDQVVAINVLESQDSNRYFGQIQTRTNLNSNPYVYTETTLVEDGETNETEFGYRFVGQTSSGIYVIETSDREGGSGVFINLMLVKFEYDRAINYDWGKGVVSKGKKRLVVKKLGEIALGDRWDANLKVNGNSILIGKDKGWFTLSRGTGGGRADDRSDRVLKIDLGQ